MRKSSLLFSPITIFFITIPIIILLITCTKTEHHKISQFISPEICGGCHNEIYNQWKNSLHNLSHSDPIYLNIAKYLREELKDSEKDEIKEAESCVKCHTPIGYITGFPKKVSDEHKDVPEIAQKGIQCDYCHSATGAKKLYNNGMQLQPGSEDGDPGTKFGPFKDVKSVYHKSKYSSFHTKSEICGTCHDVRHVVFKTKLETTYEEWSNGPYNSQDSSKHVTCQGCHMYQRPGIPSTGSTDRPKNPGYAAASGPKRDHIFTHYFVGGNSFIPEKSNDKEKSQMAVERLKNAAELSIDNSKLKSGQISISVKNTGAGHYLPTGLTDTRQMWLEIKVVDNNGKTIYTSGIINKDGYIPEDAIIYNTVFGNGKGKPVSNISRAREILKDKRIPPLKALIETINLNSKTIKSGTITVKLLYRIASQKVIDNVMGKGKIKLPIITMTEINKKIKI